jgi:dGTPase
MFSPKNGLQRDEFLLAPYAMATRFSRGRRVPEPEHPFRPLFQRDRERIVHATAFRRLMSKTQVLAAVTNDHHRTRLTHSLEVAQVSRTIARQLGLQEDLTEAIALSHDLGHPPFGHAGEDALDACMSEHGGFDHNLHALRIVDVLEAPYADRPGLNLTWEVREAMVFHSRRTGDAVAAELRAAGQPTLEARVVDAADSLAYDTHDLDDALGYGLLTLDELADVPFWREGAERVRRQAPALEGDLFRRAVVRVLIEWQVHDLLAHTQQRLRDERVESVDAVRLIPDLVGHSPELHPLKTEVETFLHRRVYYHPRVLAMKEAGQEIVRDLYAAYTAAPEEMPGRHAGRVADAPVPRVVCDYLAGMTDRFAREEHTRLYPRRRPV